MQKLLVSALVALLAGCATQQPRPATDAPPAAPVVAAPVAAAPAPAKAATQAPVKSYAGYKMKERNGVPVYCKSYTRTGTRFEEEICLSAAEVERMSKEAEQDRTDFRRNQTICGGGTCGAQ